MRDVLDRVSWPARRWIADHLIGTRAYSRNVAATVDTGSYAWVSANWWNAANTATTTDMRIKPFNQEAS